MHYSLTLLGLTLGSALALPKQPRSSSPQVNLGYATYEGNAHSNGINEYLGMRYAAPPLGQNRFRLPQNPNNETGIVEAKTHGPLCYNVQDQPFGAPQNFSSEDCLFIDVYAPANATAPSTKKSDAAGLPVMLWIQGGGFENLVNPNYNGTGLIQASSGNLVVVTFNYRIGPYGFLASEELQKEGNLNIGLHDQRAAMIWVREHIANFGGDPNKITIFGTSIGGGSVILQTLAYGGNPPKTDTADWSAAIAEAPNVPSIRQVKDQEFQYNAILAATSCSDLACLRQLDSETIQAANKAIPFPGPSNTTLFSYVPVIDSALFTDVSSAMLSAGKFTKSKPLIVGYSLSEGTISVPRANTTEDIDAFLLGQYPQLTRDDLNKINELYQSVPQTLPGVTATEAPMQLRLALMWGDAAFACPSFDFVNTLSAAEPGNIYLFRDNIIDPVEWAAGYLVPHTWEVQAVWGPEYSTQFAQLPGADSYNPGGVNHAMVGIIQQYWTSFAATGNPNNSSSNTSGAPYWEPYSSQHERLRLQTNSTRMEAPSDVEIERCAFWKSISARTLV